MERRASRPPERVLAAANIAHKKDSYHGAPSDTPAVSIMNCAFRRRGWKNAKLYFFANCSTSFFNREYRRNTVIRYVT
jgi:hypothetical protein